MGTLNHFAKDLGIPLDLQAALAVIAAGRAAAVDVGRVNSGVFINNSSLGVYARALLEREVHRDRFGLRKWLAMALAVVNVFRRFPKITVRVDTPEGVTEKTTPLVLISNNHYCVGMPDFGRRSRMDTGNLSLYIANTRTRWGMAKLAARAVLGRLEPARDFHVARAPHFTIDSRRNRLRVALDGELVLMDLPLEYWIWPKALRVFVPMEAYEAYPDRASTQEQG